MAKLDELSKIKFEPPTTTYQFKVRISGDDDGRFTNQVHNISINYVDDTLTVTAGQPAVDAGFQTFVYNLCKHTITLAIDYLDAGGNPASTVEFFPCNVESHEFNLAYGKSDVAVHKITMKFKGFYNVESTV